MDDTTRILVRVLEEYKEISEIVPENNSAKFCLNFTQFQIFIFTDTDFPLITTIDNQESFPHFLYNSKTIGGKTYRSICLFQSGEAIPYLFTQEEKIKLCIDKLISLVNLSRTRIIQEYQKEFLYYWNCSCSLEKKYPARYQLFLDHDDCYQWLEQQVYSNETIRITKSDRFFNDSSKRIALQLCPVLYIPIQDSRELIPPLGGNPWTEKELCNLLFCPNYQRISSESYKELVSKTYSRDTILLVFKLNNYFFACIVEFTNAGSAKLNIKLESQIKRVVPIRIERTDFDYLNQQIGNTTFNSKVTVVGAGSLGSYVVAELVRSGYKNITIIDGDTFEAPNTFRHRFVYNKRINKSSLAAFEIAFMHPEISITANQHYLSKDNIDLVIAESDIIIFTVGNSDIQLVANKVFVNQRVRKPVYYVWLEHDGESSHVAVINDTSDGCFECLFTNSEGQLDHNIINRASVGDIQYIHNGCGGTRIPYGNKTLLTATAILLKAIKEQTSGNAIYSYYDDSVHKEAFPRNKRCNCCGIQRAEHKI